MQDRSLAQGSIHRIPQDLRAMLTTDARFHHAWNDITPLARSEFICWITSAKKPETRTRRIHVAIDKLSRGERRPCCWSGCPHRTKPAHGYIRR
ncbi:YdeI/OmpD-associated family protein [Candidatus Saccharibacteria bacterium]|nr:MAG: YdeI/OmpD-associated family protein [Candidatus Saccharibacteria bacterium]